MNNLYRLFFYIAIFFFLFEGAGAGNSVESGWLDLIGADITARTGDKCDVRVEKVVNSVIGNNGYMSERWVVQVCGQSVIYDVEYFPPSAFPDREEDKIVQHIAD
jgi:hypothetical protein